MKNNTICPKCKRGYRMGYTGTVDGCDRCLGVVRDANGYVYHRNEKTITLQDVNTGKVTTRNRPGLVSRLLGRLRS